VNELDRELSRLTVASEALRVADIRQTKSISDFLGRMQLLKIEPINVGTYSDLGLSNPFTGRRLARFNPKMNGWVITKSRPFNPVAGLVVTTGGQVLTGPQLYFCTPQEGPLTEGAAPLRFIGLKPNDKKFAFMDNIHNSSILETGWHWTEVTDTSNLIQKMAAFIAEHDAMT
jgi:hypothetical protein